MTPKTKSAYLLATWFGLGYSPKAPGTVGALGALPLYWLLRHQSFGTYWAVTLFICLVGIWASQLVAEHRGSGDPQLVVIDEVAGVLIAMGCVRGTGPLWVGLAWALFRVFDITKWGPVGWAENAKPKGLGIMLDDLVAGVVAGALTLGVAILLG